MRSLLKVGGLLAVGCVAGAALAWADSVVSALPNATVPLQDNIDSLYIDHAGTDTKLSSGYAAAFLGSAAGNSYLGNTSNSPATATFVVFPPCPPTGTNHLNHTNGTGVVCGTSTLAPGAYAVSFASPADPAGGFNSTTRTMAGYGSSCTITPTLTGRVHFRIIFTTTNATAAGGTVATLRWGTGTAPVYNAAATGTVVGANKSALGSTTTAQDEIELEGWVTGLTLSTAVWFDAAVGDVTNATVASIGQADCFAEER